MQPVSHASAVARIAAQANVFFQRKDGTVRMYVNYRALNNLSAYRSHIRVAIQAWQQQCCWFSE